MAKSVTRKGTLRDKPVRGTPVKLFHVFLLILYGYLTVFTPNMNTYDSNGPKFVALAFLNLLTFLFLFSRQDMKSRPGWYYGFFGNGIGMAYSLLMVVSLLSFFKAINVTESVLTFAKAFTVFSATYLVSVLVMAERRGILYLAAAMSLLLIYDSITVYSDIHQYIKGGIKTLNKVKSVYSNKNILAAAVFIKIPFSLYLMIIHKRGWRVLGMIAVPVSMLAVFFMSSRAFYVGLFLIVILLSGFLLTGYFRLREKELLWDTLLLVSFFFITLALFSLVERNFYPKSYKPVAAVNIASVKSEGVQDSLTTDIGRTVVARSGKSVGDRMSTIATPDESANLRLRAWRRSWHVFRENPLLGVGLGNWKVATLKEENQTSPDYIYQYKAHNDFIETTAETGIFGGLLYSLVIAILLLKFLFLFLRNKSPEGVALLFLPAIGLLAYSFDAFFNFPHDRPEIQSLFALYTGTAIALTSLAFASKGDKPEDDEMAEAMAIRAPFLNYFLKKENESQGIIQQVSLVSRIITITLFLLLQIGSAWVLLQYFHSLKLQRIIKQEIMSGTLKSPAQKFLSGFPAIPNLNGEAEPIAVQKARYLLNEKRYREAIDILKDDRSSPWDSRPEYFMSMAYMQMGEKDSAFYFTQKVYELKPNNFRNLSILANRLLEDGRGDEAEAMLEKYLTGKKNTSEALRYASGFYDRRGKPEEAAALVDSAMMRFPTDTMVIKLKTYIDRKLVESLYKEDYDKATEAYSEKRYGEAARLFSEILEKKPDYFQAREYRAFCNFYLKEYNKSNDDLNYLLSNGVDKPNLYNLIGVNFHGMGRLDDACIYFKVAMEKGDKDGITNYNRLCKKAETKPQFPPLGGI